jgi:hypothetical protein
VNQPHEHEIQPEHPLQGVQQRPSDVGGVSADPGGGKGKQADKIVDAAPKPLGLIDWKVELEGHARPVARERLDREEIRALPMMPPQDGARNGRGGCYTNETLQPALPRLGRRDHT